MSGDSRQVCLGLDECRGTGSQNTRPQQPTMVDGGTEGE